MSNHPTSQFNFDFPASEFFGDVPQAAFFSATGPFAMTPARQLFSQQQFNPIFNQFLGTLGQQVREGLLPTARFEDFLQDFDFNRAFLTTPPGQRPSGGQNNRFSPVTQFLF